MRMVCRPFTEAILWCRKNAEGLVLQLENAGSPADDVEALLSEAEDLEESEIPGLPPTAARRATA